MYNVTTLHHRYSPDVKKNKIDKMQTDPLMYVGRSVYAECNWPHTHTHTHTHTQRKNKIAHVHGLSGRRMSCTLPLRPLLLVDSSRLLDGEFGGIAAVLRVGGLKWN